MNILMVSSYLPYPLTSGGHVRLYNLIKLLANKYKITLICEKREYQTEKDIAEVEKYCIKVICLDRKKQWSLINILKTGFTFDSFLVNGHTNKRFKDAIKNELENINYSLIHIETFYIYKNIPQVNIPKILVEHNIEYLVYKRYVNTARLLLRPLLFIDILKLKKNEMESWHRADKLIAVSESDARFMKNFDVTVVPNGVNLNSFQPKQPSSKKYHSIARRLDLPEKEILFIGDFRWMQNRIAIKWILNDIWPFLLRKVEDEVKIRLKVVGHNIPESIKSLSIYDSIIFDENSTKNTAEIYKSADILLSPITVGGGTSFKILEAMASGVPVVTTKLGSIGLGATDGKNVLIGDDTQTLVEKTATLLRDEELFNKISINARKLIEEKYSWNNIVSILENEYRLLINKSIK